MKIIGIYAIKNDLNGKLYVGSSLDINHRWWRHRYQLRNGSHHSTKLQDSWNKHGESNFSMFILEEVETSQLIFREQYWIDKLEAFGKHGYNGRPIAHANYGLKLSDDMKAAISKRHKGKVISIEHREAISRALTGRKLSEKEIKSRADSWTPERRARRSEISKSIILDSQSRKKISEALKGRKLNADWIRKISESSKGRVATEEARANMSAAHKMRKPISEETREKMSAARQDYWRRRKENSGSN